MRNQGTAAGVPGEQTYAFSTPYEKTSPSKHPHLEELPVPLFRPLPPEFDHFPPLLPALAKFRQLLLHVDAGQHGAFRVVLEVYWRAVEGDDGVSYKVADGAA